jgi:hypothetical protein
MPVEVVAPFIEDLPEPSKPVPGIEELDDEDMPGWDVDLPIKD